MPAILPASLYVGQNVDIQRSDGRVHSAVVSEIIEDSNSVKVEWFEHNETKGKEIEFDIIFRLNPQLADDIKSEQKPVVRETNNVQSRVQRPKSTVEDVPKQSRLPSSRDARKSYAPRPVSSHNRRDTIAPTQRDEVPQTVKKENIAPAGKKPNPRRSNVVKEIEKIKEDREKRRAAAQARSANVVVDKSNPNWQFIDMIEEYRETIDYNPLNHDDKIEEHQICVCVRKRPLNKKELNRKDVDVVTIPTKQNIIVHEPRHKVDLTKYLENQKFRFDYAFDDDSDNEMVYRYTAQPLVHSIFQRGMATCFAYGQTGSGKTHTMGGEFVSKGQQLCENGIYALSARDMFKLLNSKYRHDDLIASVSFFEIYSGKVFDLLNNKIKLRVLEDGKAQVQVVGLKEEVVNNADQVLKLLSHGTQVRTSGTTSANQHSSRSHAIFQLILRKNTRGRPLHGKFSLIDLAGNERGADTSSSDRQTRMEGAEINKSLLALKECIRALGRKGAHLPFRASKLTLVLRDSFVGDKAKTCMISTISPGNQCCEHTLNTLRYADRVKELGADAPASEPKVFDESVFSQHAMSPQNSDLALLRTQNAEEVSDDLLNFHEVINHMQDLEDEIIDEFKDYVQHSERFLKEDNKLLKAAEHVDYDVESFTRQLGANLDKRIQSLQSLRNKVSSFREDLVNEESISKKFNKKK